MKKKKILLVDDEESLTRIMKLNLESAGDYEVMVENKGSLAIETARKFHPNLIIMDLIMPDMDGSEIAAQMKVDPHLQATPVIFLTATITTEEVVEAGGLIGGESFIAKPVSLLQLLNKIRQHIG